MTNKHCLTPRRLGGESRQKQDCSSKRKLLPGTCHLNGNRGGPNCMVGDSVWKEQTATVLRRLPAPSPVPLPQTRPSLPVSGCSPIIESLWGSFWREQTSPFPLSTWRSFGLVCLLEGLVVELGVSHGWGECSTTELYPQPLRSLCLIQSHHPGDGLMATHMETAHQNLTPAPNASPARLQDKHLYPSVDTWRRTDYVRVPWGWNEVFQRAPGFSGPVAFTVLQQAFHSPPAYNDSGSTLLSEETSEDLGSLAQI